MKQQFTSANTSINSTQYPRLHTALEQGRGNLLDYGCGKYTEHLKAHCEGLGYVYSCYDKYNQLYELPTQKQDIILCANVLNVIAEKEIRAKIYQEILSLLAQNGKALFQVYEGNKSGIGKKSKSDCYQNNQKAQFYIDEIQATTRAKVSKKAGGFIEIIA